MGLEFFDVFNNVLHGCRHACASPDTVFGCAGPFPHGVCRSCTLARTPVSAESNLATEGDYNFFIPKSLFSKTMAWKGRTTMDYSIELRLASQPGDERWAPFLFNQNTLGALALWAHAVLERIVSPQRFIQTTLTHSETSNI